MAEPKTVTLQQRSRWRPGTKVRLNAERLLLLSPPPAGVATAIAKWFEDPEIGRFLPGAPHTPERAAAAIEKADNRSNFFFGIFDREKEKIIGYTQVFVVVPNRWARTSSAIGDKAYWGGGYAVEARAAILDFLFRNYGLNKVSSYVYGRNIAAIFNNRQLGYTSEGLLRQQERDPEGGYRDIMCFGILRNEWLARRKGTRPVIAE